MSAPCVENSGTNSGVVVVPQPHGGALVYGRSNPGSGRKPAAIRKAAMKMLSRNLPVLEHIASGATVEFTENGEQKLVTPKPGERVAAIKVLAELGMGERVAVSDVRTRIRAMLAIVNEQETWTREELLARLGGVWG
jgi:hypothetical protein